MGRRDEFGAGADHGREIDLTAAGRAHATGKFRVTGQEHLPPTPAAMDRMTLMVGEHQEHIRNTKAAAARESDQDDKAKASKYGLGGNKALRKHLADKHELEHDDAMEMERPHHYHREWHTKGEYNPDGHDH